MEAAWKARRTYIERLHRMGLKVPGGRPPGRGKVTSMADRAKVVLLAQAGELEAGLPADIMERPVESLPPAAALGRAALSGLRQLIRIIEQPLNLEDLKQQRLLGDMSLGAVKMLARTAEGEFRARRSDAIEKLLAQIAAENATKSGPKS